VESTGGSVVNINTIRQGELDFGVAQSDWQYHAINGTKAVRQGRRVQRPACGVLAAPRALYRAEPQGSQHRKFEDFKGKRFNVGNPARARVPPWRCC
jgi:TRAP-type uncharacterized transport system substrate-binding protein